ncbi:hypothetical protein Salat_2909500 [Sesamum alatum]|uniref:Uncharacterized protein n=1 Tax=Sesamum alatum TaxID=300844 RepID=A0AAE2C860_9LAMI|nr:hypothetical protein Salat_2909500 [Sesamum alatum]
MRVTGNVRGKPVHILIYTGSTHNFLDLETTKRLGCKLEDTEPFPVAVANGNKMYSSFACKSFGWKMQGISFTTDMMILPLGGCDMVLGVQWLVTLGDINWNFHQLKIEFDVGGVIQRRDEHHTTTNHGLFLCLDGDSIPSQQPAAILDLLVEFSYLFEEPKTLPPRRDQDHDITLKPSSPLSM